VRPTLALSSEHLLWPSVTTNGDELAWCFSLLLVHYRRNDEGELCPHRRSLRRFAGVRARSRNPERP
jgi:hypothetical protein